MNGPKMTCPACEKEVLWPGPCDDCKDEFDRVSKEIDRLERQGHTYHCAARIVFCDGECECGINRVA
jgi:hypothetical protein